MNDALNWRNLASLVMGALRESCFTMPLLGHIRSVSSLGKGNLTALDRERRILYQLNFLDGLVDAGTAPEVAYSVEHIQSAIANLSDLMPNVSKPAVRSHVARTLQQVRDISQNSDLQSDCATALASLQDENGGSGIVAAKKYKKPSTGVAAFISTIHPESVR